VKIVDANVLLYAVNKQDPNHKAARAWLEAALSGVETIGFAWQVLLAFFRIATSPRRFSAPLSVSEAATYVEAWLQQGPATVVHPTPRHLDLLTGLLDGSGTAGNLVSDAHLAALALEHAATIASFDRDFLRFRGIRLDVPSLPR
jgi:toxin-antitoxin system PIN domain toxin